MTDSMYTEWSKENTAFLKEFKYKKIRVLYSGGKDSSLALDFIARAGGEFGFSCDAWAGAFPPHRYPREAVRSLTEYWEARGVTIHWQHFEKGDADLARSRNPCFECQRVRKRVLTYLLKEPKGVVLVTGHSLWDIVSYAGERLFEGLFSVSGGEKEKDHRLMETSQRFYVYLEMKDGYSIYRPLLHFNDPEIEGELEGLSVPVLLEPCRYGSMRPKRVLKDYYQKMGLRFDYNRVMEISKTALGIDASVFLRDMPSSEYLAKYF